MIGTVTGSSMYCLIFKSDFDYTVPLYFHKLGVTFIILICKNILLCFIMYNKV